MTINEHEDAEYLLNVYLYFSDCVRKKIAVKYSVGDDVGNLSTEVTNAVRKLIKTKRAKDENVFLEKVYYSISALETERTFYDVGSWIDGSLIDFEEILMKVGRS